MKRFLRRTGVVILAVLFWGLTMTIAIAEESKPEIGKSAIPVQEIKTAPADPARQFQPAEEVKPTTEVALSVLSAYISKGDELSRNSIVVQPQITVGYQGWSLNVWGNLDTRPYLAEQNDYKGDKRQNWTETDLTIAYNRSFGLVKAGVYYAYFGNAAFWNSGGEAGPDQKDDQEAGITLGLDTLLSPSFKVLRSFDSTQVWYMQLGISHTFEFNKVLGLTIAATGSYLMSQDDERLKINNDGSAVKADGSRNDRYNNFHDAVLTASLPIKANAYLTITPQLSYVFPICSDAKYDMQNRSMQVGTAFGDRQS
ncbi:MAG TPA: hypothetical protein DCG53_09330, partial [Syntrophus sp. (in: bacteria)]|nr:hypothetical protein [Syntrophus sp. (in: bacteria)]